MAQEVDLIDLDGGTAAEYDEVEFHAQVQSALDLLDESIESADVQNQRRRRLLVGLDEDWWRRGAEHPPQPTGRLESLGDDAHFLDAILGQLLPEPPPVPEPSAPSWPYVSLTLEDDRLSTASSSRYHSLDTAETHVAPCESEPSFCPQIPGAPPLETPPRQRRHGHRRSCSYAGASGGRRNGREGGDERGGGEVAGAGAGRRSLSLSAMTTAKSAARESPVATVEAAALQQEPPPAPAASAAAPPPAGGQAWLRASMRRLTRFRLNDPPPPPEEPPPPPPPPPLPPPHDAPEYQPQQQTASNDNDEQTQENEMADDSSSSLSPLGQWPHSLSFVLASLACTLGLFNISRFALLSIQFGVNFILQFLIMSLVLGIPLFTFHVSLGQLLAAGTMDMWKISPIFQGIGIALLVSQAFIGIYSIVGVSWLFVYFRDSFITKQDTYGWAEPYERIYPGVSYVSNITARLEETVGDYFSGTVLQRHYLETPPPSPGPLKFQVTFNLAVVWMIVFICLSKGLKSYGKVVYIFSLLPVFGMLVLISKLLGIAPTDSRLFIIFPQTDWSEFFLNTKSWTAAIVESFYTWGLLGASAMQIASHNRPKHYLHRDTTLVTIFTIAILLVAALLANVCSEILHTSGFIYTPSSFERKSSYRFLQPMKSPTSSSYDSTNIRWMEQARFLMGERIVNAHPNFNPKYQSGYQALRLATELVPATLAAIGAEKLSPFWSILFYFVLILFGIAQQLAIMHCVITGIMAIKVETLKNWETTITFFTCACGFILGLPMATELGIFVVYFLDYCVGGGWWIILLYLIEIGAVFMVRGRPYSGETVVATLFSRASAFFHDWAAPLLSFTWNVIVPVILMVLSITVFKNGNFKDLYRWQSRMSYDFWPSWSRQIGSMIQLIPLITVPFVSIIQSCRYLSEGPPDIFDRMQLLYRPPLDTASSIPELTANADIETSSTAAPSLATIEDPPPKYTPPPSYTTATGARIAKLLRQSFRRSVRRITSVLGNSEGTTSTPDLLAPLPPPPDYAAVLVEINQTLSGARQNDSVNVISETEQRRSDAASNNSAGAAATVSSMLTATDVAHILRNSFRRAIRENNEQSSSSQRLVDAAAPINQDSVIIEELDIDKSVESVT